MGIKPRQLCAISRSMISGMIQFPTLLPSGNDEVLRILLSDGVGGSLCNFR